MNLQDVPKLTQVQRMDAQSRARNQVMKLVGEKPTWHAYSREMQGEHSGWITNGLGALLIFIVIGAWALSATRLYTMGYTESLHNGSLREVAIFSGAVLVLLAELTVLGTMLSRKVLFSDDPEDQISKRRLGYVAIYATILAISANVAVTNAHEQVSTVRFNNAPDVIFVVSDSLIPIIVLAVSTALEQLMLRKSRERRPLLRKYNQAKALWDKASEDAMQHPRWKGLYANELRDTITRVFARRKFIPEYLNTLSDMEWAWLVKREMAADDWFDHVGDVGDVEFKNEKSLTAQSIEKNEPRSQTSLASQDSQQSPRRAPALERALRYLEAHPEDAQQTNRALGDLIGVSKDVAGQAKTIFTKQLDEDTQETQAVETVLEAEV